jgi:hypothetical protein
MKTGNHDDASFFREEDDAIRETVHSCPPPTFFHYGKLQGGITDCFHRTSNGVSESQA